MPLCSPALIRSSSTSGWPMSQKLSLLARFFFKSSVSRSVFIWTLSRVTPGHFVSSMSLAASGSNWKAAKIISFGLGTSFCASSMAKATCFCSSGACSGPKETTARSACPDWDSFTQSAPRSFGRVSVSACNQRVPASGSTLEKRMCWPFLPLMPALEKLVPPFGLTESLTGTGDGGIACLGR